MSNEPIDDNSDTKHSAEVAALLRAIMQVQHTISALPRTSRASEIALCAYLTARKYETPSMPTAAILAAALGTLIEEICAHSTAQPPTAPLAMN